MDIYIYALTYLHTHIDGSFLCAALSRMRPFPSQQTLSAVSHTRHAWCVTQQTLLLCHTANIPAM